jgi:catechol 2,3-dioxygenase-like lactoylglutathione lyase family enzyme
MIVEHVGLAVRDLDAMTDFYCNVFSFAIVRRTPLNAYLVKGDALLELMQEDEEADQRREPATPDEWKAQMVKRHGINHVGFRVDNLDSAINEIAARGGRLVVEPFWFNPPLIFVDDSAPNEKVRRASRPANPQGWRIAMFADPEGTMLELLER